MLQEAAICGLTLSSRRVCTCKPRINNKDLLFMQQVVDEAVSPRKFVKRKCYMQKKENESGPISGCYAIPLRVPFCKTFFLTGWLASFSCSSNLLELISMPIAAAKLHSVLEN